MSLSTTGYTRKTLAEIKTELDAQFVAELGAVNTKADSVTGQIIGILAEGIDTIEANIQDTYDAMYPSSAEGTSLDGAVSFVGVTRLPATATVVTAAVYGDESEVVTANTLATVANTNFYSTSDVVISRANALDVTIEVLTVADSSAYQILAGGQSATYTSGTGATAATILAGLAAELDTDGLTVETTSTNLRLYSTDGVSPFTVTTDAKLSITKRGSPVVFVADTTGAVAVPIGALTSLETGREAYNIIAGSTGRDVETDTALRTRYSSVIRGTGGATVEAIKARLLSEVDGVTSVKIYENRTTETVDSIPAGAFETIIQGGTNTDIAAALWTYKPAGIETYGNVSIDTTDSNGDSQTVSFSRPVEVYAWLTVTINALNSEQTAPTSAAIKAAIVEWATTNMGVGDDLIIQRFFAPIYDNVTGIASLAITADVTASASDTPTYVSSNITIARAEVALFDTSRITVVGL